MYLLLGNCIPGQQSLDTAVIAALGGGQARRFTESVAGNFRARLEGSARRDRDCGDKLLAESFGHLLGENTRSVTERVSLIVASQLGLEAELLLYRVSPEDYQRLSAHDEAQFVYPVARIDASTGTLRHVVQAVDSALERLSEVSPGWDNEESTP